MSKYVYVNIKATSFKIWAYECFSALNDGRTIIFLCRGRIGLPMEKLQKYKKIFDELSEAEAYIAKTLKRKRHKGYVKVKYYPYFNIIARGRPLWELLRFIDLTGQRIDEKEGL